MAAMQSVGVGHRLSAHARVREEPRRYVVELDLADFTEDELSVVARGRQLVVLGDQRSVGTDTAQPFRLQERLEESFRLPDDADVARVKVIHRPAMLEIRVPRVRLDPHQVPIRHSTVLINPDAEPC